MKRHEDSTMRENARRGAITTWRPSCHRKAALSAWPGRTCRYCGYVWNGHRGDLMKLYRKWDAEQKKKDGQS